MEFGLVGIDGYNINTHGSGLTKKERSDPFANEGNRATKVVKRVDDLGLACDNKQQMLSFSSSNKPEVVGLISAEDVRLVSDKNNSLEFYHQKTPSSASSTYDESITFGGFGSGNMNGSLAGIRGSFTPAQWIELEHQAMIYKYLNANVPVPSNLLIPIRKAIQSAGFPGFSIGSYPSYSYGWGSFHLGFSGKTDPEPGRCRRTDGKKWQCSRDAVPDHKYCEKHIKRGCHRSRKLVEGRTGQAASGASTTKVVPPMTASMSSLVTSSGGAPNGGVVAQHPIKGLQPAGATNPSTDPIAKRVNDQQGLSVMPPTINLESKDSRYSIPKQHISFDESSVSDFGIVSNDSLLNPSQKSYNSLLEFNTEQNQDLYPLRHFMDNWPKDQSHRSANPWPKDLKSDWTQLSMSIPVSTDFSSSSFSPNQEKVDVLPLRLSRELHPSQMGLGVETQAIVAEVGTKQNDWIPVAWGNSMDGPLGEVLLNNSSNAVGNGERWNGSSQFGSSPTGVLQKSTFVSLSNSSSSVSPKGGEK